ncbi:hypothetical protein AMTRI_Chr02g215390 [Amborella trichopoda]
MSTVSSISSLLPAHLSFRASNQLTKLTSSSSLINLKTPFSLCATLHHNPSSSKIRAKDSNLDTSFFDELDPEQEIAFEQPSPPEGWVKPPPFYELPPETEEEIAGAYEEIYGPAYSGESVLGNDIYVMDAKVKKSVGFGKKKKEKVRDGFEERVVQVRRVTKVVKGGKQLSFRAIVVVGDKQGRVGVGVGKAKEVISAVEKSATNARRNIVTVPMTKYSTFPHRFLLEMKALCSKLSK